MKFKVNDLVLVRSEYGAYEGWEEGTIARLPSCDGNYINDPPTGIVTLRKGYYGFTDGEAAHEDNIRKKHPPQQDSQASDESFHDLIHRLNGEKVEA